MDTWLRYQMQSALNLREPPTVEEARAWNSKRLEDERKSLPPQRFLRAWWGLREICGLG